jgi:hypothetical protein
MRSLDFIAGSSSFGARACSHVEIAIRFRPFLEEVGSEDSGMLSGADESGKEDIFNRDKMILIERRCKI